MKDGETVANLAMTIARGGVITGFVRDIGGRPVPGLDVRVLRLGYNATTGERTLGAPSTGSAAVTDDRGAYRAFGLPPGGYFVVVVPRVPSGRGNDDIRQLTAGEVRQALQAARSGASVAAAKPDQRSLPPARVNYAPVFHPAATDIGAAATIVLGVGEERTGADVTIQLVPTATVSGTISSTSGVFPQSLSVRLVPAGRTRKCSRARACAARLLNSAPTIRTYSTASRRGHIRSKRSSDGAAAQRRADRRCGPRPT